MATQLARVAIVSVSLGLAGCELLANVPGYTEVAGDGGVGDPDGGDAGGDDAMAEECQLSTECTAPEVCVMGACRRCDSDAHCGVADANVCLPDGTCADVARIAYASPAGSGLACSLANPCSMDAAFANAAGSATVDIVKLLPGTYARSEIMQVNTDNVILAGQGATVMAVATIALFRVTTGTLSIVGAELVGMQQFNALCFGMAGQRGTLKLHRVVSRGGSYGVGAIQCDLEMSRTMVTQNASIGVYVSQGTARIANSVVIANGVAGSAQGGVQFLNVLDARVEMSTIVGNTSVDDAYAGGVTCSGTTSAITTSISWGNVGSAMGALDTACSVDYSVVEPGYAAGAHNVRTDPLFQAVGDFHLQATSPARECGDPALTTGVDFDDEPRPQGGAELDCGADEVP
jgi:hypothetical protein